MDDEFGSNGKSSVAAICEISQACRLTMKARISVPGSGAGGKRWHPKQARFCPEETHVLFWTLRVDLRYLGFLDVINGVCHFQRRTLTVYFCTNLASTLYTRFGVYRLFERCAAATPELAGKTITPHVVQHTSACLLLQGRCRHQHHPCLAWPRQSCDHQCLCRDRSQDESRGDGALRHGRRACRSFTEERQQGARPPEQHLKAIPVQKIMSDKPRKNDAPSIGSRHCTT